MSLKGRIEAVIYAAEEPVTLQQLLGVLAEEAAQELQRIRERQGELALGTAGLREDGIPLPSEPDLLNDEVLEIENEDGEEGEIDGEVAEPVDAGLSAEAIPVDPSVVEAQAAPEDGDTALAAGPPGHESEPDAPSPAREELSSRERDRAVREYVRELLAELQQEYAGDDRGIEIREVAGGFRFATKPEYHDAVRGFAKSLKPPLKLSLQALETLAVVAYKQPVTAPEISEIRGVDSAGVLGSLMARKLVTTAGRKQVVGRPILYKTTKDFLLRFGLKDTSELPSIEEFEKMASELAEPEEMTMTVGSDVGAESPHTDPEMMRSAGGGAGMVPTGPGGPGEAGTDVIGTPDTGGSVDAPPAETPPSQGDVTEPQPDGDSSPADEVVVDGRMSGGTAVGTQDIAVDSSAGDAMVRRDEERGF